MVTWNEELIKGTTINMVFETVYDEHKNTNRSGRSVLS